MRTIYTLLIALALVNTALAQPTISLQPFVTGLTSPVDIVHCGDDRLFIVQRDGYIRIIKNGVLQAKPFLDIDARVNSTGGEQGMLGLAFHPDYATNGYFFVNYIYDDPNASGSGDYNTRVSRFRVSAENPDSAVAGSEVVVLPVNQPFANHNGGDLAFGPDGYLYIPLGDGGDGGDPGNRAQNPQQLLGKILRLDVDSLPYSIPPDNPFVNDPNTLDEIWAIGMRNPWRFSFDRLTGDMWVGDVGQGTREEVNFEPANTSGRNYGWRCYEGNIAYNTSGCSAIGTYTFPVFDYDNNSLGCSVVGGVRYRGCKYPDMYGYYIFTDFCSGRFWEIHDNGGTWATTQLIDLTDFRYVALGEDVFGELYVADISSGAILKLVDNSAPAACTITLSGNIATEVDSPVAGVSVVLSGAKSETVLTDANGNYSFTVTAGGSYTITPTKNNDVTPNNGVTTLDISLIRKHILGSTALSSNYKVVAANGDNSSSVSTLDISLIRGIILANTTSFPNGRLWEFVSGFDNASDPFTYLNTRTLSNVMSSQTGLDFIGVKLGDVNGSWKPE